MIEKNIVPLDSAIRWAANWKNGTVRDVNAYLIPMIDIKELQSKEDVVNIRGYMGIADDGKYKFLLVGVDHKGDDLIDYDNQHYVYDFTTPCPTVCSVNSPLYLLGV